MTLFISEEYVNATKGWRLGENEPYEPFTDDIGRLFRSLQREYGRCVSKMYIGEENPRQIGWVFSKRVPYTDTGELYEQEVWVTLHDAVPTRTVEYHYHEM